MKRLKTIAPLIIGLLLLASCGGGASKGNISGGTSTPASNISNAEAAEEFARMKQNYQTIDADLNEDDFSYFGWSINAELDNEVSKSSFEISLAEKYYTNTTYMDNVSSTFMHLDEQAREEYEVTQIYHNYQYTSHLYINSKQELARWSKTTGYITYTPSKYKDTEFATGEVHESIDETDAELAEMKFMNQYHNSFGSMKNYWKQYSEICFSTFESYLSAPVSMINCYSSGPGHLALSFSLMGMTYACEFKNGYLSYLLTDIDYSKMGTSIPSIDGHTRVKNYQTFEFVK